MTATREFRTTLLTLVEGTPTRSFESRVGGGRYVTSGSPVRASGSFTGVSDTAAASGSYVSSVAERAFGSYISA